MDDDLDDVTDHLKERSTWLRIFFMVGFALALYVVGIVILFITLAQVLFNIFTGADNRNLRRLGADLAEYVNQILRYLTYNTDVRPFPFSPFPDQSDADGDNGGPEDSDGGNEFSERGDEAASHGAGRSREGAAGPDVKKNSRDQNPSDSGEPIDEQHLTEESIMSKDQNPGDDSQAGNGDEGASLTSLADIKVRKTEQKEQRPNPFARLQTGGPVSGDGNPEHKE